MRYRVRTFSLSIASLFVLGVAFELFRFCLAVRARHPDAFVFAGMAVTFGCAALLFLVLALSPQRDPKPSEQGSAFRFQLRTLLIWLAVLPAIVGLAYAYRDWLADLIIDEWLMRGIP